MEFKLTHFYVLFFQGSKYMSPAYICTKFVILFCSSVDYVCIEEVILLYPIKCKDVTLSLFSKQRTKFTLFDFVFKQSNCFKFNFVFPKNIGNDL